MTIKPRPTCLGLAVSAACLLGLPAGVRGDGSSAASSQPATAVSALPANWQQLSQADFVALCESWTGPVTGSARFDKSRLAQQAWTAWLNNPPKAAALTADQFITLSTIAVSGLSNADSALLRNVLLRRFPTDKDIQPLGLASLDRLTGPVAIGLTFTNEQVNGWLQSWVNAKNGGGDLSLQDAAKAWDLCHSHLPVTSPMFPSLAQSMWKYLQVKEGWDPLADADVMPYYNRLFGSLPKAQQGPLCQNVWRRLNANVPQMASQLQSRDLRRIEKEIVPGAVVKMSDMIPLVAGFLTTQGATCTLRELNYGIVLISFFRHDPKFEGTLAPVYQSVATSMIGQLSQNTPVEDFDDYQPPGLGKVFESDADRQQLRNLFSAAVLENRLAAAQILSWSYMYAQKREDWWKEVSGKIADPQSDGDTKAFWLLVSGEIEETKYQEANLDKDPDIKRKRPSLDKALAAAQGEPMRLLVLEEFATYYLAVHHGADGVGLLASVIDQFSPGGQAKIKLLEQRLTTQQGYLDSQAQIAGALASKASQAAQLKDYQASLGRAQMDHDQGQVTRLQAAIADVQSKMQSNGP